MSIDEWAELEWAMRECIVETIDLLDFFFVFLLDDLVNEKIVCRNKR